jgi:hypothetical protein
MASELTSELTTPPNSSSNSSANSSENQNGIFGNCKEFLMFIAPVALLLLLASIYYHFNNKKYKSCTCSKDEKYTYTKNQPKQVDQIELGPDNSFTVNSKDNKADPVQAKEHYCTAYYRPPQNNPETHRKFSGV